MMSYLKPTSRGRTYATPPAGAVPHGGVWRLFRISYWMRLHRARVRGPDPFGDSAGEHETARDVALPSQPVVDSLNGTFFSGSRWQRPP